MAKATFGAGCFWGVEEIFRTTEGVTDTTVGYMGGSVDHVTYQQICTGNTGHAEVVQVEFDPAKVSYGDLVDIFFNNHNPTQLNRQGPDVGTQYRSAIFTQDDGQKAVAEEKTTALVASGRFKLEIATVIEPVSAYWPAEEYHQKYLQKRGMASCHI